MSFTLRLTLAFAAGLAAAVALAPLVALAAAGAGYHFPFPRIFDRTVMATMLAAMLVEARDLDLVGLLRAGFATPAANAARALTGFIVALAIMTILFVAAAILGCAVGVRGAASLLPRFLASAIVIAIVEEAFFRAVLFGGMTNDMGRARALAASAVVYAFAHVVRSPERFYVSGFDATAGLRALWGSFAQLAHPIAALPTVAGLFLLGLVLAQAVVATGTVYFSIGLHCGVVVGAKLWPKIAEGRAGLPGWLAGYGHQALISGPAAWALTIVVLIVLRRLSRSRRRRGPAV
ncbi:MAG TPA: CPBP family intramembrane glutamic endopeptidase [Candidatus Binataceae bacterium]|nr:CPBP family intramembrane glutamic endopeptidase [Candidatus Binataceae bacterium]